MCQRNLKREAAFKIKATSLFYGKYLYQDIIYKNNYTKIVIFCGIHGYFEQTPQVHLKSGCPQCSIETRRWIKQQEFLEKSIKLHKHTYSYHNIYYIKADVPVIIWCKIHGYFKQTPKAHLKGRGCFKCANLNNVRSLSSSEFITKSNAVHGSYKYPEKYINTKKRIKIICNKCGVFYQTPMDHLAGCGCPGCTHYGFNPNDQAILYYIKDNNTGLYKVGISNKNVEERFGINFCKNRIDILMEQSYEIGSDAYLAEQEILDAFNYYRCSNESWPKKMGGKTEFFNTDILNLDLN